MEDQDKRTNFLFKKRGKRDKIWVNRKSGILEASPEFFDQFCYFCDYFGKIVQLHHLKHKKNGGGEIKKNLLPVCPNHHNTIHQDKGCELVFNKGYYYIIDKINKRIEIPSIRQKDLPREYSTGSNIRVLDIPTKFNAFGKVAN